MWALWTLPLSNAHPLLPLPQQCEQLRRLLRNSGFNMSTGAGLQRDVGCDFEVMYSVIMAADATGRKCSCTTDESMPALAAVHGFVPAYRLLSTASLESYTGFAGNEATAFPYWWAYLLEALDLSSAALCIAPGLQGFVAAEPQHRRL